MKTKKFSGVMDRAYGKKLAEPIKFGGQYEAFERADEVRNANEWPNDDGVVKFATIKRKNAARAKAMNDALTAAGIEKPTLVGDEQLRLKKMFDILVANGSSEDEARAIAASTLKLEWDDDDSE